MNPGTQARSVADVWVDILAPKFIRFREVLVRGAEPHGSAALHRFGPARGQHAIDIGCGFGEATLALAERVGATGFVTGLDVVPAFLELAGNLASEWPLNNVAFALGDAETFQPSRAPDYLFARFGTMFFERPAAAFRNLRRMLKPEGKLVMTTWRSLDQNPWLGVAKAVARRHLPSLAPDAVSCGPGPFSLADPEQIRTLLMSAGFDEVSWLPSDAATLVGRSLEEAIEFQLALGPAGELVREAGAVDSRVLRALRSDLARALEPFLCEEGVLMPSSAWLVRAR